MYINAIQSELQHSKMTMFADNMAFYCHENSPTNLQSKLIVYDNWRTFMIIGGRSKLSQFNHIALVANNDQLENVTKFRFLGVTINQYPNWHNHIEPLQSTIAKTLGVLKRIKHFLPVFARKIYVSTMVIPILE